MTRAAVRRPAGIGSCRHACTRSTAPFEQQVRDRHDDQREQRRRQQSADRRDCNRRRGTRFRHPCRAPTAACPRIIATVVITIGRSRTGPAESSASLSGSPSRRSWFV